MIAFGQVRGLAVSTAAMCAVVAVAAAVGALFVFAAGKDPGRAFEVMFSYTLASRNGFAESVVRAIPLTLAGLGIAVAFRANVFNIGADGQAIAGAIAAVAAVGAPWAPVGAGALVVFIVAGTLAGTALGGLAGYLRARYNANEIIVTIMLNYIALQFLGWVVRGPMQERMHIFPRSDAIPAAAQLGVLVPGTRVHAGIFVALAAAAAVHVVLRYTSAGYQLRAVGINPRAARYGGIDDRRVIFLALAASGALAGLAGVVEVGGVYGRLEDELAPGLGIAAVAAALLARLNPLAVPFTALLFGILHAGSGALQREAGVPFPIVWVIEGIVILAFLALGRLRERGAG
jgi:simple sugar transport system permease protein